MQISYFFRSKRAQRFSIESLFGGLVNWISSRRDVRSIEMPFITKGIRSAWYNGKFARQKQGAINHVTGDVNYIILFFSKRKINILTIHDTGLLGHYAKGTIRHLVFKKLWFDWPMSRADFVTTISSKTKDQLVEMGNTDPGKIRLIPNFVDPSYKYIPSEFNKGKPRILFIGTAPHKNLARLVEAISGLSVELEIIGALSSEIKLALSQNQIEYKQSESLEKEELIQKYIQCDLVAFPTLHEGFGMPILEAQATGRCILTSNISPTKEIAGEGAVLIDPLNVSSIRSGILKIISNDVLRKKILHAGLENIQKYQIDQIAGEYDNLYIEATKNRETN